MKKTFNTIEYKEINYILNNETGRFEKQPELIGFQKLPFELKVEVTFDERIKNNGAKEIITGRTKDKKRLFFTGLIKTSFENCYSGDDYSFRNGIKKNSIVVFIFTENNRELTVYYFNNFYKQSPVERTKFVNSFIKSLCKQIHY